MTDSVLVTGASKGIGRAIALRLAQDGYQVIVHFNRDRDGAEQCLQQIETAGGSGRVLGFDVADRTATRAALEADIAQHGAYYGVVSNAGISRDAAFPALTDQEWDSVIHTNLDSFYNVIQPCVMPMIGLRRGGRIITLSSVSGMMGNRGQVNYSAAKAGVLGLTKAMAREFGPDQIRINALTPGLIQTDITGGLLQDERRHAILDSIPLGRLGTASDVANAALFLASDLSGYLTGITLDVNGGMLIH